MLPQLHPSHAHEFCRADIAAGALDSVSPGLAWSSWALKPYLLKAQFTHLYHERVNDDDDLKGLLLYRIAPRTPSLLRKC